MSDRQPLDRGQLNWLGKALILVEKRTYRPAGWKKLRERMCEARFTPKRIYADDTVFDRDTGREIQTQEARINQSIRYSIISTAVFK